MASCPLLAADAAGVPIAAPATIGTNATQRSARRAAHPGAHIGKLETGYFADLVILNSNPLEDIKNASDIDTVVKNGVAYPADSILR